MNTDRVVSDWLRSAAPLHAPTTLLDATLERVATLPQDRPAPGVRAVRGRRADLRLLLVAAAVGGTVLIASALLAGGPPRRHPSPVAQASGWIAAVLPKTDGSPGSNISLARPGEPFHAIAGNEASDPIHPACPSFSGDGTRLAYGLGSLPGGTSPVNAALVIQHVAADGTVSDPWSYPVTDGGAASDGFAPPCAVWARGRPLFAFVNATPDPADPNFPTGSVITVGTVSGGRMTFHIATNVIDLSWSPAGDTLAVSTDDGIGVLDASGERAGRLRLVAGTQGAGSLDWSPDGDRIAYQRAAGGVDTVDLVVRDLRTDQESVVASGYAVNHGIGPLWSPAGDALLYQRVCAGCREQHEVVVLTLGLGRSTWTPDAVREQVLATPVIDGFRWYPFWTTWSPDGSAVLEYAWSSGSGSETAGLIVVPVAGDAEPQMVVQSQVDAGEVGVGAGVPWVSPTMWARVP